MVLLKIMNEQNSRVLEKFKNSNSRVWEKFSNSTPKILSEKNPFGPGDTVRCI